MKLKVFFATIFALVLSVIYVTQAQSVLVQTVSASPLSAPISAPISSPISFTTFDFSRAIFYFDIPRLSERYRIDVSTLPDMSWDVYLDFATGDSGVIAVDNPQDKWDKYSCGRVLYWKAYTNDKSVSTPINATMVNCPVTPPPSYVFNNLSAALSAANATFSYGYSGPSQNFMVDLSTLPNMSWDVYLDFAKGNGNLLSINNPTKWDKYTCGRTLYYRVWNYNRTISSPIQTVTVNCQSNPAVTQTTMNTQTQVNPATSGSQNTNVQSQPASSQAVKVGSKSSIQKYNVGKKRAYVAKSITQNGQLRFSGRFRHI